MLFQCLRDSQLPSEIFLTTLRLTDNCDELKSTKDLIIKEIQVLVSGSIDVGYGHFYGNLFYTNF